jgi:hypothetical protein
MPSRYFDLNIQRVLEHWSVSEALREVIANALDEQALTRTADVEIIESADAVWRIRDFGRGLRYEHFTQNENPEKLAQPSLVIGKFGVGLKDALATFDRHDVGVLIRSAHAEITIESVAKHGFDDVRTLHAVVGESPDPTMPGTEFILSGLSRADVDRAKEFFLRYSDETVLESTRYGAVLHHEAGDARIYVNGLRVATEPDFLFSYNITSLTKALRAALNRERSNVGRQAYSDRVKAILLACESSEVAGPLAGDLAAFAAGTAHDETGWIDVALHACRILNSHERVVFATADQVYLSAGLLSNAEGDGYRVIVVPENVALKLPQLTDLDGNAIRDLDEYRHEWNESFVYDFVSSNELAAPEQAVFALTAPIMRLLRSETNRVKEVRISRTMRIDSHDNDEAVGVWDEAEQLIVIKRDQLSTPQAFLGTLLHEIGHALSGAPDVSREFEHGLTYLLGSTGAAAVVKDA